MENTRKVYLVKADLSGKLLPPEEKNNPGVAYSHMQLALYGLDDELNGIHIEPTAIAALYGYDVKHLKVQVAMQAQKNLAKKAKANPAAQAKTDSAPKQVIRPKVYIYTDGSCLGNPGAGGWAAICLCGDYRREFVGSEAETTNNRMELMAAIGGLSALKKPSDVTLYSDSAYLVNAFEKNWINGWQQKGWVNSKKQPVENKDLWEKLIELTKTHNVTFAKVTGHANNELNNQCDKLARTAAKEAKK